MAKITPQVTFKKDAFIFGKDTLIEGTLSLPGIDLSTIESIEIHHAIHYGVAKEKKNVMEGFYNSEKKKLYTGQISLVDMSFSFPLVYPNIKKSDGVSFDDEYSLIQNLLTINIKEKGFFTLKDTEKIIIPIEWGVLSDPTLMFLSEKIEENEEEVVKTPISIDIPHDKIMLPWQDDDLVSKVYYETIVSTSSFAKLGDTLYRSKVYNTLLSASVSIFVIALATLIVTSDMEEPMIDKIRSYMIFPLLIVPVFYILQYLPKRHLKSLFNIDKYFPEIKDDEEIAPLFLKESFRLQDLFDTYEELPNNPLSATSGTLNIRFTLSHEYTYKEGKYSSTHTQYLLAGDITSKKYSNISRLLSETVIDIPFWVREIMAIKDSEEIGLEKTLMITLEYDDLPDESYEVIL